MFEYQVELLNNFELCCSGRQVDKNMGCIWWEVWEDNKWTQAGELVVFHFHAHVFASSIKLEVCSLQVQSECLCICLVYFILYYIIFMVIT